MSAYYRFHLLRADDREGFFADDATAIAAAGRVIGDYPGIEIWCERLKAVTLSVQDVARLHTAAAPRRCTPGRRPVAGKSRLVALRRSCRLTPSLCEDPSATDKSRHRDPRRSRTPDRPAARTVCS